jgi:hypothetical protein
MNTQITEGIQAGVVREGFLESMLNVMNIRKR